MSTLPHKPGRKSRARIGEFVGMITDNPDQQIEQIAFCAEIINDHEALNMEQARHKLLPIFSKVAKDN